MSDGKWVPNDEVAPETNVSGRRCQTSHGREFVYFHGLAVLAFNMNDLSNPERVVAWYFPENQSGNEQ